MYEGAAQNFKTNSVHAKKWEHKVSHSVTEKAAIYINQGAERHWLCALIRVCHVIHVNETVCIIELQNEQKTRTKREYEILCKSRQKINNRNVEQRSKHGKFHAKFHVLFLFKLNVHVVII